MLDSLGRKPDAGVVNAHALVQFDDQELGREAIQPSFDGVPIGVTLRSRAPDLQKRQTRQRDGYLVTGYQRFEIVHDLIIPGARESEDRPGACLLLQK